MKYVKRFILSLAFLLVAFANGRSIPHTSHPDLNFSASYHVAYDGILATPEISVRAREVPPLLEKIDSATRLQRYSNADFKIVVKRLRSLTLRNEVDQRELLYRQLFPFHSFW